MWPPAGLRTHRAVGAIIKPFKAFRPWKRTGFYRDTKGLVTIASFPTIGVLPLYDSNNKNIWINPMYLEGVMNAGGLPVLLPLTDSESMLEQIVNSYDGFIFTGGQDVDPALYGEEKIPQCNYQAPQRDWQEMWMLRRIFELDKPVLGICRGMQMMAVAAGGTMYQDIPTQRPSDVKHNQIGMANFRQPTHVVDINKNSKLYSALKQNRIVVNSMHHQAVKDESPQFKVTAWASDGLIEVIEHKSLSFAVGVQWHPEFLWPEYPSSASVFKMLVDKS